MVPVVSVAVAAEHGVRCIEDEVVPLAMADEPEDDLIRDVYARFLGWGWVLYCVSSNYEAPPSVPAIQEDDLVGLSVCE